MLSRPTCDHASVLFWAEQHKAVPVEVLAEGPSASTPTLSFVFHSGPERPDHLRPISWETFFAVFDMFDLSLIYEKDPRVFPRFYLRRLEFAKNN